MQAYHACARPQPRGLLARRGAALHESVLQRGGIGHGAAAASPTAATTAATTGASSNAAVAAVAAARPRGLCPAHEEPLARARRALRRPRHKARAARSDARPRSTRRARARARELGVRSNACA